LVPLPDSVAMETLLSSKEWQEHRNINGTTDDPIAREETAEGRRDRRGGGDRREGGWGTQKSASENGGKRTRGVILLSSNCRSVGGSPCETTSGDAKLDLFPLSLSLSLSLSCLSV
jgi:hypothetical protein